MPPPMLIHTRLSPFCVLQLHVWVWGFDDVVPPSFLQITSLNAFSAAMLDVTDLKSGDEFQCTHDAVANPVTCDFSDFSSSGVLLMTKVSLLAGEMISCFCCIPHMPCLYSARYFCRVFNDVPTVLLYRGTCLLLSLIGRVFPFLPLCLE